MTEAHRVMRLFLQDIKGIKMPTIIAEFDKAVFLHGDSLNLKMCGRQDIVVSDPPAALSKDFWLAMHGVDNFVIFAGLKRNSKVIAEKLLTCNHFADTETNSKVPVVLHSAIKEDGPWYPQHYISRNTYATVDRVPHLVEIYDEQCNDCLTPEFIKWAVGSCVRHDSYETIYDPFCGNGSTAIAAKLLGKQFVGMDIDLERVTAAAKKYEDSL